MSWINWLRGRGGNRIVTGAPKGGNGGTMLRRGVSGNATLAVGYRVANTYAVKRLLGAGGMGVVYLAHHEQWNLEVALKTPNAALLEDSANRHRITTEAQAWTDLGLHPHIAHCYYVHVIGELLLLVVEYVDGGNLRGWIADGRCTDLRTGLDLAIQFCHGLEHAHAKGLIHRDVKPENILLTAGGTLKVTDFGIASVMGTRATTSTSPSHAVAVNVGSTLGWGIGTPGYMAPEQWVGTRVVDARSDLFGFGVCLYEMLFGQRPYDGRADEEWQRWALDSRQRPSDPRHARRSGVPARLSALMRRCVAWEAAHRPATAAEVRRELCAIYEEQFHEPSTWAELPPVSLEAGGFNNRALSYLALAKASEAESAWDAALASDPVHAETTFNRGLWSWRAGRTTDIALVRSLERVIAAAPQSSLARVLLAEVHLERGDGASAEVALDGIGAADDEREDLAAVRQAAAAIEAQKIWSTLEGHVRRVTAVSLSADGRLALSASFDCMLLLWDLTTGNSIRKFKGHAHAVLCARLSADGRLAISGSDDRTVRLWDVDNGACCGVLQGHSSFVNAVDLSPDERLAVSGSSDETLRVWDRSTQECLFVVSSGGSVTAARFLDGTRVVFGTDAGCVCLWDLHGGACKVLYWQRQVASLAVSNDGRLIVSGGKDGDLRVWNIAAGELVREFGQHAGEVTSVAFGAGGEHVLSGSADGSVRLWEIATGRCLRTELQHERIVSSIATSRDGQFAISASWDDTLKLWSQQTRTPTAPFRVSRVANVGEQLSNNLAYAGAIERARRALDSWNFEAAFGALLEARQLPGFRCAREATELWGCLYPTLRRGRFSAAWPAATLEGHLGGATGIWSSPTGGSVLVASVQTVRLWSIADARCIQVFEGHDETVTSACLTRDETQMLSGSADGTVRLWDVASGACLHTFIETDLPPVYHAFGVPGRGGRTLVTLSGDGRVALSVKALFVDYALRIWDVALAKRVARLDGHRGPVTSACLSADGRLALSGSADKRVKLWDVTDQRCIRTMYHGAPVSSVRLSVDGRFALSSASDGSIKQWDVATGRCRHTLDGTKTMGWVSLGDDGELALGRCADGCVLWRLPDAVPVQTFEGTGEASSVCVGASGRYALVGDGTGTVRVWFLDWDLERPTP